MSLCAIPLTLGQVAIVDAADWERLSHYKWFAERRGGQFDAIRWKRTEERAGPKKERMRMAEMVIQEPKPGPKYVVDHINGDPSDNRRMNLRWATLKQNAHNRRQKPGRSERIGVYAQKDGRFRVQIIIDGRRVYLGTFKDREQAADTYRAAVYCNRGKFGRVTPPPDG